MLSYQYQDYHYKDKMIVRWCYLYDGNYCTWKEGLCIEIAPSRFLLSYVFPENKVHEAYMGPTWGRQDPGGPHVGPMNLAIRVFILGTPYHLPKSQPAGVPLNMKTLFTCIVIPIIKTRWL